MSGYVGDAVEDLRRTVLDGVHAVERAASAMGIQASDLSRLAEDPKRQDFKDLADVDRARVKVQHHLDAAVTAVYDAADTLRSLG